MLWWDSWIQTLTFFKIGAGQKFQVCGEKSSWAELLTINYSKWSILLDILIRYVWNCCVVANDVMLNDNGRWVHVILNWFRGFWTTWLVSWTITQAARNDKTTVQLNIVAACNAKAGGVGDAIPHKTKRQTIDSKESPTSTWIERCWTIFRC